MPVPRRPHRVFASLKPPSPSGFPLTEKIAYLRLPEAYRDQVAPVEVRETHMSWVFLTADTVYKLKKPVRQDRLDYGTLDQRLRMCGEEVRLNRRLADWVYLGISALVLEPAGRLALLDSAPPANAHVVEWLVRMRRLPDASMLDKAIADENVHEADLARAADHLALFMAAAPCVTDDLHRHVDRLRATIAGHAADISAAGERFRPIVPLAHRLLRFLDTRIGLIGRRVTAGRIIEGHGDLRPEHVFLGRPPAIIDCIEFSRTLRWIDPLEDLAFLWMECDRLGAGICGERFLERYLRISGDEAPEPLMAFYQAQRACLRVKLALGHLGDTDDPGHWLAKADEYLDIAHKAAAGLR